MSNSGKCANPGCDGEIDFTTEVQVGSDGIGYPCQACGRLHTQSGRGIRPGVFFRQGVVTKLGAQNGRKQHG